MLATGINPFTGRRFCGGVTEIAKFLKISTFFVRKWGLGHNQELSEELVENDKLVMEK
jgi:hypothetical protein